jgi:hypothetical protein
LNSCALATCDGQNLATELSLDPIAIKDDEPPGHVLRRRQRVPVVQAVCRKADTEILTQ